MRRALLIGIDNYPDPHRLNGCIEDIKAMRKALEFNGDGTLNFEIVELPNVQSSKIAMGQIETLFATDSEIALLYFSGHGCENSTGSEIVFPRDLSNDGYYNGLKMRRIMDIVNNNNSKAKNKIIILDCCHSGDFGRYRIDIDNSDLRPGVSILSACQGDQFAMGRNGATSFFTEILCMALEGSAADFLGNITIGSLYAYIDRFFSVSEQRPVFKTNVTEFIPIKRITPKVSSKVIREVVSIFKNNNYIFPLDPSYEESNAPGKPQQLETPYADPAHVAVMQKLQMMVSIGFVEPVDATHMYHAAMQSKGCRLTELGKYYWILARKGLV